MASSNPSARFSSSSFERTANWVLTQDIPTDIIIKVGDTSFPLHKFLLVAKSGYIKRKVIESAQSDLSQLDLTGVPGGAEVFEKAAKFCYGVNFEISVHNVAGLRCAAHYLEMDEEHSRGNLVERTEEFIGQAALRTLPGAVAVLRSCEGSLLAMAEELGIVQRCVDAISFKACNEANFPTRSPPNWWCNELFNLSPISFQKILAAMRSRSATPHTLTLAVSSYADHLLSTTTATTNHRSILESLVSILPAPLDAPLPPGFLCKLLRAAISLNSSTACRRELERRIAAVLDEVVVADLLAIALDGAGVRVADLDSVRRIIGAFVESECSGGGEGLFGGGGVVCSAAMQKVARTVDAFVGEIASDVEVSVSKFAGVAGALPKSARRVDDDLYRAIDIFLKAHPGLDEIEREKVCSVMDPLKLSYEARLHASQNKRLPLQIVLHALYYDQLKLRSGVTDEPAKLDANVMRKQVKADVSLVKENEALKTELAQMKLYVSELQKGQSSSKSGSKKPNFLSSVSRTLGKLNPFRHGSKDTSHIEDNEGVDVTKPRRRRFSIS